MGARLKDIDFGPYVQGSLAGHARQVGAAEAKAAGDEALGRGVAVGIGAFTAKALRKHQESRQDARYAVEDARAADAMQLHKDQIYAGMLHDQMVESDSELSAAMPMLGPDGTQIGGDPTALAAAMAKRQQKQEALETLMARIGGSPTFKAQKERDQVTATQTSLAPSGMTAEVETNDPAAFQANLDKNASRFYAGKPGPGPLDKAASGQPASGAAPIAPVDPIEKALHDAYEATDRAGAAQARESSLGQMVDDAQAKLRAAKNPQAYRDWSVKVKALLAEKEKAHRDAVTEGFSATKASENYKTLGTAAAKAQADAAKDATEKQEKMDFANSYLRERGLLPTHEESGDNEDNGTKFYGRVEDPYADLGAAQARIDEEKSDVRVEEAQRKGETREDFLKRRQASKDSLLAEGWKDRPWAQGHDDAWIAKNGPMLHKEEVAARATQLLAGKEGLKNLKSEAMLADDAYAGALREFTALRSNDYEERLPSTRKAWLRVEKLRGESDGLRNAYNAAVRGEEPAAAPKDPEVDAIENSTTLTDDQKLDELAKLQAKRAGSR